ncbi:hypothetical protein [Streptomyces hebeiensis]
MNAASTHRTVEETLRDRRVRDVLVPGWVDRDGDVPEFRPQPVAVWLRLDEGVLRFASAGRSAGLTAARAAAVDWSDLELLVDAEDEVIVASYGEQLFGDGREELVCTRLRVHPGDGTGTSPGTKTRAGEGTPPGAETSAVAGTPYGPAECGCLALDFEGGHTLFLDPTWTFGIRLGNGADERRRLELYGGGPAPLVTAFPRNGA